VIGSTVAMQGHPTAPTEACPSSCALLFATAFGGRRLAHKAKALISDVRRTMRERRNAERLAAAGARIDPDPDVRLPVADPIFDANTGLAHGWMDQGWSAHDLTPGKPASLDLSGFGGLILAHAGLSGAYGGLLFRYRAPESFGDFLEVRLETREGAKLERVRTMQPRAALQADGFAEVWIPMRELNPGRRQFAKVVFHAWHVPLLPWYLRKLRDYEQRTGTRVLDVVDVLLNHDPDSPLHAEVGVESYGTVSAARAFSYSGNASGFAAQPAPQGADGTLNVAVEPYSITAIEIRLRRAKP
jgi:hypothetical protein